MAEPIAETVLTCMAGYAGLGLVAAAWLYAFGLKRFDRNAAAAPLYVKVLWLPGLVALWPFMVARSFGLLPAEDRTPESRP